MLKAERKTRIDRFKKRHVDERCRVSGASRSPAEPAVDEDEAGTERVEGETIPGEICRPMP